MKQWRIWTVLALLLAVPLLRVHATSPLLLTDQDTKTLLAAIRERHAPLSWFATDWPLQNHFYRPLPTLTFEIDNALYGDNASGYGWTNAILCALCAWMLYWLLLEALERPPWAFAGAALFTLWTLGSGDALTAPTLWLALVVTLIGLYRHSFGFRRFVPAALVLVFLAFEVAAPEVVAVPGLRERMIDWLPGRTASVLTFFALGSLAAYLRFERGRSLPVVRPPTSTDVPRSVSPRPAKASVLWLVLSVTFAAAAFASYEQAVMLPAIVTAGAIYLRWTGRRPLWPVLSIFWALLLVYLGIRNLVLPSGISGYQAQQLRHGMGVWNDLGGYAIPNLLGARLLVESFSAGLFVLISPSVLLTALNVIGTIATAVEARRNAAVIAAGWAMSTLAFLPMAWVKPFAHYDYWPMALRTILCLGVAKVAWELVSIAACPPALQAPPRPSPAPGSLPRR